MTTFYPDVSNYQPRLSLTGALAVCAKASQGVGYVDPYYIGFKGQAKALGIPQSAYHWLDTAPAVDQARHAFSVVGSKVPLMIDDEQNVVVVAHTLDFVAEYRRLGGLVTLEYLPRWIWERSGKPDLRPLAAAGLSIVSSNYSEPYSDHGVGFQPYGGVTPGTWQYTSTQMFNGQLCDFNGFPGTVEQLAALWFGGAAPAPITVEDEAMYAIKRADGAGLWLCRGGERTPIVTGSDWEQFGAMTRAGLIQKPAPNTPTDGQDVSGYVIIVPNGTEEFWGGPLVGSGGTVPVLLPHNHDVKTETGPAVPTP